MANQDSEASVAGVGALFQGAGLTAGAGSPYVYTRCRSCGCGLSDEGAQRAHLVSRSEGMASEIRSLFADVEHWNTLNPDEMPIDPDPEGELTRLLADLNAVTRS